VCRKRQQRKQARQRRQKVGPSAQIHPDLTHKQLSSQKSSGFVRRQGCCRRFRTGQKTAFLHNIISIIALQTPPGKRFYRFDTAKTLSAWLCLPEHACCCTARETNR